MVWPNAPLDNVYAGLAGKLPRSCVLSDRAEVPLSPISTSKWDDDPLTLETPRTFWVNYSPYSRSPFGCDPESAVTSLRSSHQL